MLPDIKLKDYYLQFIYNAKKDNIEYNNNLKEIINKKDIVYDYLLKNKDNILNTFNIDLDNYNIEWNDKTYNTSENLYQCCIKLLNAIDEHPNKEYIIQLCKYCNLLRAEHNNNRLISLTNKRKNMKLGDYRKYVNKYYSAVHKCVLEGNGYKFSNGIGTYIINKWKLDKDKIKNKPKIDFAATNAKKKELLDKGIKLYDEKEAAWYKARHIPYDGVDYRVYKEDTDWYEITFINSTVAKSYNLDYQHTEYVAAKYRGMSYMTMAEKLCNSIEDIYSLQVDIKYKLNILLYKYPIKYLNFIRNDEQSKYKYRENNR